jgi:SET domain-containing protein
VTNPAASWLSPRTRVGASGIEGRGLFASEPIPAGEVVAVKGGSIFGREELTRLAPLLGSAEIHIGPIRKEDREGSMIFSNHSCDPNLGVRGQIAFVTLRDVAAGEELTHDWAMTDDDDGRMECRCGTASCRGVVTGKDWRRPELQERYGPFMSSYLQEKIARSRTIRSPR